MDNPCPNSIEILSVELLDQNRPTVDGVKKLAQSLGLEFGWHYLLDLTWIIHNLGAMPGQTHHGCRRRNGHVAVVPGRTRAPRC